MVLAPSGPFGARRAPKASKCPKRALKVALFGPFWWFLGLPGGFWPQPVRPGWAPEPPFGPLLGPFLACFSSPWPLRGQTPTAQHTPRSGLVLGPTGALKGLYFGCFPGLFALGPAPPGPSPLTGQSPYFCPLGPVGAQRAQRAPKGPYLAWFWPYFGLFWAPPAPKATKP